MAHGKICNNVGLALAPTCYSREGPSGVYVSTMNDLMSLFKIEVDGDMAVLNVITCWSYGCDRPFGETNHEGIVSSSQGRLECCSGSRLSRSRQ